jgi:phosphodiesterase/alkaline phosphatase D-like protein
VASGDDITLTDFELSVELAGLEVTTTYYYRVVVNNTVGVAESMVSSFTTTDLRK